MAQCLLDEVFSFASRPAIPAFCGGSRLCVGALAHRIGGPLDPFSACYSYRAPVPTHLDFGREGNFKLLSGVPYVVVDPRALFVGYRSQKGNDHAGATPAD